jgi:hypothetical protein
MPLPFLNPPVVDDSGTTDEGDDDDDLDAPLNSQNQALKNRTSALGIGSPTLEASLQPEANHSSSPIASLTERESPPSLHKTNVRGFRIGGKAKKSESQTRSISDTAGILSEERIEETVRIPTRQKVDSEVPIGPKTARKGFKIGGKGKVLEGSDYDVAVPSSQGKNRDVSTGVRRGSVGLRTIDSTRAKKETTPTEEEREETAEEKAERKRFELKRKNEEAARKQAQSKKKKRF